MEKRKYKCDVKQLLKDPINVDWKYVSTKYELSTQDLKLVQDYINWDELSYRRNFRLEELRIFADKVNWFWVNYSNILNSETILREFKDYIDPSYLKYIIFHRNIMREFNIKPQVFNLQRMKKKDLTEFVSRKEWDRVSSELWNEQAIKKCKDYVNWSILSKRKFSAKFYWEMRDYFDWDIITRELAPGWKLYKFKRFQKYLNWEEIKTWKWINKDVKNAFRKRLGLKEDGMDLAS